MSLLNLANAYNKKLERKRQEKVEFSALTFFASSDKTGKFIESSLFIEDSRLWKSFDDSFDLINIEVKELEIDLSEILKEV